MADGGLQSDLPNSSKAEETNKVESSDGPQEIKKKAEGQDLEDQVDELMALQAIYENEGIEICDHDDPHADLPGGIIEIPIYPPEDFQVKMTKDHQKIRKLAFWRLGRHAEAVKGRGRRERQILNVERPSDKEYNANSKASTAASESASPEKLYNVKRLPPITLTFAFPHDYPSSSPPDFTVSCCWLEKQNLSRLCEKLDKIWEEGDKTPVVMNWINFLQEEAVSFLGLKSPYDLGRVLVHLFTHPDKDGYPPNYPEKLKRKPLDQRGIQTFSNLDEVLTKVLDCNLVTCDVCFEEKAGEKFLRLHSCDAHTLCRDCMRGWFEEQINEGAVSNMTCPGYKCEQSVLPTEVEQVVSPELYARYDKLLLKTAIDTMRDVAHCPRPFCQFPVVLEDNLGLCQKCHHAFCDRCKGTYHGHTPCKLKLDMLAEICEEYEKSSEAGKLKLEMRYGRRVIQNALAETKTERWLESNSKQCPSCGTSIQKKDGCNKMTCTKCRAFFCWLCRTELSRSSPYSHYSHPTSPCANRLFEGVEVNAEPDDVDDDNIDDEEANDNLLIQMLVMEGYIEV